MHTISNFIGGRLVAPASGAWLDDVEPATGRVYARVPDGSAADVEAAVEAARRAFPEWSGRPAAERAAVLERLADLIEENLERFARAESIDSGKPLALARAVDIPRAVANFRFFATAILHHHSEAHFTDERALNYTRRDPIGVVGLISPWNLPLYLLTWKLAPAIAVGNAAVAKPSEVTPMTAHLLAELCDTAGVPPGVVNVVHGRGPSAGAALVAHPQVRAISFTGGTDTGRAIAQATAPLFKKVALEMGGKNPNIVFADADLERALPGSLRAAFANQGEICLCGSRLFVQEPIFESFVLDLVRGARRLRVGDPLEEDTDQGALVSEPHRRKVESYIELARREGGDIRCGGSRPGHLPPRCAGGFFLEPTVITGLSHTCRTNQEEIFGPVVSVIPFRTEEEVIEMANSTSYGLSASVWTRDLARGHRMGRLIESGTVWVNCWLLRDLRVPFGGMKQSGVGREGGAEALRFFTEAKNVCVGLE
jgi:aminomuconate-semialdehyde/2-hydroxymuconate-6-semialdehyde dehydrogenase